MTPFLVALGCWFFLGLVDAAVKGRVVARYAPSTYQAWALCPAFWKDTGGKIWKWRNCLALIAVGIAACGFFSGLGLRFLVHFCTMFATEFWLYWIWISVLRIPQKQWFEEWMLGEVPRFEAGAFSAPRFYRRPRFGEVPADPAWLPGWYRAMRLHRRWMIGLVLAANAAGTWVT